MAYKPCRYIGTYFVCLIFIQRLNKAALHLRTGCLKIAMSFLSLVLSANKSLSITVDAWYRALEKEFVNEWLPSQAC